MNTSTSTHGAAAQLATRAAVRAQRRPVNVPAPRVLCVDSDAETQGFLKASFPEYEVICTSRAHDAIRAINTHTFDLYLLEYWLPDWNGVGLCRDIRKSDPNVPICFCTAADTSTARGRVRRAGATHFFEKPLELQLITSTIGKLMQFREARNEAARKPATAAVLSEIEDRTKRLGASVSSPAMQQALERVCRNRAQQAFLHGGGTVSAFAQSWDDIWSRALAANPSHRRAAPALVSPAYAT